MLKPTPCDRVSVRTTDGRDLTYNCPCVVTVTAPACPDVARLDTDSDVASSRLVMAETPTGDSVLAVLPPTE